MLNEPIKKIEVVAITIFFVIVFYCILQLSGCFSQQQPRKATAADTLYVPPITHYTDDNGKSHATTEVVAVNKVSELKSYYQHIIDSLIAQIKSQPHIQSVQDVVLANTNTSANFKPKIDTIYIDSSKLKPSVSIDYEDDWFTLHGTLNKNELWHYEIRDSLAFVTYLKRKYWYSLTPTLYIDAVSANPHSNIYGLKAVKLHSVQPKKWSIGLNISYSYTGYQWQPTVGIGLQRNLVRF